MSAQRRRRGYFQLAIPRRFGGVDFVAITTRRKSSKRGTAKRRRGAQHHSHAPQYGMLGMTLPTFRPKGSRR